MARGKAALPRAPVLGQMWYCNFYKVYLLTTGIRVKPATTIFKRAAAASAIFTYYS